MKAREMLEEAQAQAQQAYDNLNERERKLVLLLGAVMGALVVLLPLYLVLDSIDQMERENREFASVLEEMATATDRIEERRREREQAEARYEKRAPSLGSFLEAEAREQGLDLHEVNDQPEQVLGNFTRRRVRATLPNVDLRSVIKMLDSIENSPYPVAIERLQIDHGREDRYTVQLGINAYDRDEGGQNEEDDGDSPSSPTRTSRRAR